MKSPEERREAERKYYLENKERIRIRKREWRKLNRDHVLELGRKRYIKHKEKMNAYARTYYQKHKEYWVDWGRKNKEILEKRDREWRLAHPERVAATVRRYRLAHPRIIREIKQRRQAWQRGNGGRCSTEEWREACVLWGNKCLICGEVKNPSCDHILPVVSGGRGDIQNLQLLCKKCNAIKGTLFLDYRPLYLPRATYPMIAYVPTRSFS